MYTTLISLVIFMTSAYAKTFLTIEEIIARNGFPVETHTVTTLDGFILSPVRIPAASNCNQTGVVAFLPGGTASGHIFVSNKPANMNITNESYEFCSAKIGESTQIDNRLPFEFAQRCFDVWLLAYRGTEKGLKHIRYKTWEKRFWTWSLDEIVKFDLTATIDYIRLKTQKDKLSLIGHSEGATLALFLATYRDYQQDLDALILLAPVGLETKQSYGRKYSLMAATTALYRNIDGPVVPQPWFYDFWKYICDKPANRILLRLVGFFMGNPGNKYDESVDCNIVHYMQSSIRTLNHALQIGITKSQRFHKYDFGLWKNIAVYGQTKPPEYDIKSISLSNIVISYGLNDRLISDSGISNLVNLLKFKPMKVLRIQKFNHVDYLISPDVGEIFNRKLLQVYQEMYCGSV